MNGLDLFSGIGGITKALEGYVKPVAYCENDRYAQAVLLSRMGSGDLPYAPIWDDIRTLGADEISGYPEIIYGGFPCQDISIAGRGAGLAGKRSGLFFEILRLAKEVKPKFIFLENVPNIRTKGLQIVVRELADIGYDCRWFALPAYQAPLKEGVRWFLLAKAASDEDRRLRESRIFQNTRRSGESLLPAASERLPDWAGGTFHQPSPLQEFERSSGRQIERDFCGMAHGVQSRVDRLRGLGNAVVPAQAREAFERLMGLK